MEQNTVERIRQAELEAQQVEKEAAQECDRILQSAHEDANSLIDEKTSAARKAAAAQLEKAKDEGAVLMQQALEEVKGDVASLYSAAKEKKAQVKDLILGALV